MVYIDHRNRFRRFNPRKINNHKTKGDFIMTVERQFSTEEEVDQWMDTHLFGNAESTGARNLIN